MGNENPRGMPPETAGPSTNPHPQEPKPLDVGPDGVRPPEPEATKASKDKEVKHGKRNKDTDD